MLVRCLMLLLIVTGLGACSTQSVRQGDWPETLPPQGYFESIYAADSSNQAVQSLDEYLVWIKRYYLGWELYRRGWLRMTNELLETIDDPAMADQISIKMADLGQSIAGEWAKKSRYRTIHTRHVSVWGNALLEAMARGDEWQLINHIQQDVDLLLAHQLAADDVTLDRYYARDDNDPFQ